MFVPHKEKALQVKFRELKPGGLLIANVWVAFALISMAGGLMAAIAGPSQSPPPPNPHALSPFLLPMQHSQTVYFRKQGSSLSTITTPLAKQGTSEQVLRWQRFPSGIN